jgi:ribosomal protein L28
VHLAAFCPQTTPEPSRPAQARPLRSAQYYRRLDRILRQHLPGLSAAAHTAHTYSATMASILRRSCSLAPARRAFSTSTPRLASLQWDKNNKEALAETVPAYPYGAPTLYKQSARGLYGEQRIRFGNNVSVKGKNKSRRSWRPNIQMKRLFSKALNRFVQVRVSSRVLRTMDKLGGLDEYLLGEKETRIRELGQSGWWLRWAIMQTNTVKKRFAAERVALGLPADTEELRIEEEDAEAVLAASIPDAEIAELTLDENADPDLEADPLVSEILAEDDVFQVEQSKNLPPLRFRVARNKYIMLTAQGWRSLTPSPVTLAKQEKLAKIKIREGLAGLRTTLLTQKTESIMTRVRMELDKKQVEYTVQVQADGSETKITDGTSQPNVTLESRKRPMTEEEIQEIQAELEPMLKDQVKNEIKRIVQERYEYPIKKKQAVKEANRLARRERKAENRIVAEPIAI